MKGQSSPNRSTATGEVLSINNINISEFQAQSLQTCLTDFKGLVSLSSSMYSAIFNPIP